MAIFTKIVYNKVKDIYLAEGGLLLWIMIILNLIINPENIKLDYKPRKKSAKETMTTYDKAIKIMFKVLMYMILYLVVMAGVSYLLQFTK